MSEEITIPAAPAGLPGAVETKWRAAYARAFKEAQNDEPEQPNAWPQVALKAANKTIRVATPESLEEALALEPWQFVHRAEKETKDGTVLAVVTREGKKAKFPVAKKAKPDSTSKGERKDGEKKDGEKKD
jgi:hypothetical protein